MGRPNNCNCYCDNVPIITSSSGSSASSSTQSSSSGSASSSGSSSGSVSSSGYSFSVDDPACGACDALPLRYQVTLPDTYGPYQCTYHGTYILHFNPTFLAYGCVYRWETIERWWGGSYPPFCATSPLLPLWSLTIDGATIEFASTARSWIVNITSGNLLDYWSCLGQNTIPGFPHDVVLTPV